MKQPLTASVWLLLAGGRGKVGVNTSEVLRAENLQECNPYHDGITASVHQLLLLIHPALSHSSQTNTATGGVAVPRVDDRLRYSLH